MHAAAAAAPQTNQFVKHVRASNIQQLIPGHLRRLLLLPLTHAAAAAGAALQVNEFVKRVRAFKIHLLLSHICIGTRAAATNTYCCCCRRCLQINEFVKRVRAFKIHLLIVGHIRKAMPAMFGKDKAQRKMLDKLPEVFFQVSPSFAYNWTCITVLTAHMCKQQTQQHASYVWPGQSTEEKLVKLLVVYFFQRLVRYNALWMDCGGVCL